MSPIFIPPGSPITAWGVQLDPPAVATARTALDLNVDPVRVDQKGIDWGQAAITAYMAQQSKYGSAPADFIVPNRTVTIPLFLGTGSYPSQEAAIVGEENARSQLQQKVGLLQREGGFLLRQRAGGPAMYADIVNATLTLPDVYGETAGVEPDVSLVLECLPDFYGDEVTLDAISATGVYTGILKLSGATAVVQGDYPARARIIVTDTSGDNQLALLWGIRSRHYDASTEAALFYEAESMTALNGATVTALSGASGGDVLEMAAVPATSWTAILETNDAPLSHTGSYRVWARCFSATSTPQLRLLWGVGSLSVPVTNDPVTLPSVNEFYLLDLGTVRLDAPPIGSNQWFGVIQAYTTVSCDISIDCLYFQPLDDGAGQLAYVNVPPSNAISATLAAGAGANDAATGTLAWTNPGNITTDDGSNAFITTGSTASSEYLKATSFGFSIPSSATVAGIELTVKRRAGFSGAGVFDHAVRLVKAGTVQATDRSISAFWDGIAYEHVTYGAPADLWGGTWAPSDINNSGFGAAISAGFIGTLGSVADVDFMSMTVYFSFGGFSYTQDAVVYANGPCELRHDAMFRQGPGSGPYGPVSQVVGDLVRLPPSGIEDRPCQVFIKPTRGDLDTLPDLGLDGMTVQVKYRPCWLSRP